MATPKYVRNRLLDLLFKLPTDWADALVGSMLVVTGSWLLLGYFIGGVRIYSLIYHIEFLPGPILSAVISIAGGAACLVGLFFSRFSMYRLAGTGCAAFVCMTTGYGLGTINPWFLSAAELTWVGFYMSISFIRIVLLRRTWMRTHPDVKPPKLVQY